MTIPDSDFFSVEVHNLDKFSAEHLAQALAWLGYAPCIKSFSRDSNTEFTITLAKSEEPTAK